MDLSGSHFIYSGIRSKDYNLIFVNTDTERMLKITGDVATRSLHTANGSRRYYLGDDYSNSQLVFEAEIMKEECDVITKEDRREIEKWLFNRPGFLKLYVDPADDCDNQTHQFVDGLDKYSYLNCRMTNPSKIESDGGVVGYKFTVECDSSMAWQDKIVKEFVVGGTSPSSHNTVSVEVDTDSSEYIYPRVTIKIGNTGGKIVLSNTSDDVSRITSFNELQPGITLIMDGDGINYISGGNYSKFVDKNFIRLVDGENTISVNGDIKEMKIEFQNRKHL